MITYADLRQQLTALEEKILAKVQTVVEFTPIARTSANGSSDAVNVQGDPRDRQRAVRRVSPWGISGRPIGGAGVLAAIVKAVGGAFGGMNVGIASDSYGPQDLEEGETAIWNKVNGTMIRLKADGSMTIDAASGKDIVINGGSAKVARVGDHTTPHTHTMTFSLSTPTGGGTVSGTITASSENPTIAEGAENFKA